MNPDPQPPYLHQLVGTIIFYGVTFAVLLLICVGASYGLSLILARVLTGMWCNA